MGDGTTWNMSRRDKTWTGRPYDVATGVETSRPVIAAVQTALRPLCMSDPNQLPYVRTAAAVRASAVLAAAIWW